MPSPSAQPTQQFGLETLHDLPVGTTHVAMYLTRNPNRANSRVSVRVECTTRGTKRLLGTVKMGMQVWTSFIGPAAEFRCRTRGIICEIREVEYATPPGDSR